MNKKDKNQLIFNWILKNQLAVGSSPSKDEHVITLRNKGVKNIIGLCSVEEICWHKDTNVFFNCKRIVLPDSNGGFLPNKNDLKIAFEQLQYFVDQDITFIHCFASIERSPLLCIMYIMKLYKLKIEEALDYVKNVHPPTNPTNLQLSFINEFIISDII